LDLRTSKVELFICASFQKMSRRKKKPFKTSNIGQEPWVDQRKVRRRQWHPRGGVGVAHRGEHAEEWWAINYGTGVVAAEIEAKLEDEVGG